MVRVSHDNHSQFVKAFKASSIYLTSTCTVTMSLVGKFLVAAAVLMSRQKVDKHSDDSVLLSLMCSLQLMQGGPWTIQ